MAKPFKLVPFRRVLSPLELSGGMNLSRARTDFRLLSKPVRFLADRFDALSGNGGTTLRGMKRINRSFKQFNARTGLAAQINLMRRSGRSAGFGHRFYGNQYVKLGTSQRRSAVLKTLHKAFKNVPKRWPGKPRIY